MLDNRFHVLHDLSVMSSKFLADSLATLPFVTSCYLLGPTLCHASCGWDHRDQCKQCARLCNLMPFWSLSPCACPIFGTKYKTNYLKTQKLPSVIILALLKQKLKYLCSSVGIAFHRVSGARFWREKQHRPISWGEFPYLHTSAPS